MLGTPPHRVKVLVANSHLVAAKGPCHGLGSTGPSVETSFGARGGLVADRGEAIGDTTNRIQVSFQGSYASVSRLTGS